MKNTIKNTIIALIVLLIASCAYEDDYLNPTLDKTVAYFASFDTYTRTMVVGEGLHFKVGAAMAGVLENTEDRQLQFEIPLPIEFEEGDTRVSLPTDYFNYNELSGAINTTIPKGEFMGYFTVRMDSTKFLSDPNALLGVYSFPVKLINSSLDTLGKDSITVSVKYMAGVEGFYLYKSKIVKKAAGVPDEIIYQRYQNESDNDAWFLLTQGPFKVEANPAASSISSGVKFLMTVNGTNVEYETLPGGIDVQANGENKYDASTRDFYLNYQYEKDGYTYQVTDTLLFRNRIRDNVNETREYLSYLR